MQQPETQQDAKTFDEAELRRRIDECPQLPSLRSINSALADLVKAEQSFTSQIAEIVRRDPSLTSRVLRLVNSVFFGLSKRIHNIEDAIFYLGLRHIRELALATPVLEDCDALSPKECPVDWSQMWRHSIAVGMLTRDVLTAAGTAAKGDTDYIAGLVHNVGKIIMGITCPEAFSSVCALPPTTVENVCEAEENVIGWNHAQIGAYYLKRHNLSEEIVEAVRWHHQPQQAGQHAAISAAIQVADHLVRYNGIAGLENLPPPGKGSWIHLEGWALLFGLDRKRAALRAEPAMLKASRLPAMIRDIV